MSADKAIPKPYFMILLIHTLITHNHIAYMPNSEICQALQVTNVHFTWRYSKVGYILSEEGHSCSIIQASSLLF